MTIIGGVAEAKSVYKLYGEAPLGRKPKTLEAKPQYPFDQEYHPLSTEQRDMYLAQWEGLSENDTPPFPKGGTKSIYLPLIKGHERITRGAMLRLVAQIDENGIVQELVVYESLHKNITELAMSVMFPATLQPVTCAGKPYKMDFLFDVELRKRVKRMNSLNSEDIPGRIVQQLDSPPPDRC